jgi:hypothetical protein
LKLLLSTTYFGPVQYYSKLVSGQKIVLERYENYPKQTYRNRCIIYGANGPQTLTIPVSKGNELKVYTKDIRIDNSANWQKIHFKAIESAYRCSPFYLYYIDDIIPFYEKKHEFLYELNLSILSQIGKVIGFPFSPDESESYIPPAASDYLDFRDRIHPKPGMYQYDPSFRAPVYTQVFEPKSGFTGNLSILDLLFNTGPDALEHLKNSVIIQ